MVTLTKKLVEDLSQRIDEVVRKGAEEAEIRKVLDEAFLRLLEEVQQV